MSMDFNFILSNNSSNGFFLDSDSDFISNDNNFENIGSILTMTNNDCGMDAFDGKDVFGSCDFSNINGSFFANASSVETAGSIAYGTETIGNIASGSVETAGSVACAGIGGGEAGTCSFSGGGSFSSVC